MDGGRRRYRAPRRPAQRWELVSSRRAYDSFLDAGRVGRITSERPSWGMLDSVIRESAGAGTFLFAPSAAAGDVVGISFCHLPPPATSHIHYCRIPGPMSPSSSSHVSGPIINCVRVVATHHNMILLRFIIYAGPEKKRCEEFFVYKASSNRYEEFVVSQGSPPMLVNVPSCGHTYQKMGILCPGDHGEFMVAHLVVTPIEEGPTTDCPVTAELCCMVMDGHELKRCSTKPLRIHYRHGEGENLYWWQTDAVVAIDDNTICWVDYLRGILVCSDVAGSDPVLIYVQLPVDPYKDRENRDMGTRGTLDSYRNVSLAQDGDIKFVDFASITYWFFGKPAKQLSVSPYSTINTWTLSREKLTLMIKKRKAKSFVWMKDATLEDDEFIALTKSNNIPYVEPEYPVVDIKNPQTIYFMLRKSCCDDDGESHLIGINMSTKMIDTCVRYNFGDSECLSDKDFCNPFYSCNAFYNEPFLCLNFSKYPHIDKAVCVLGSDEGVRGTIYFTQGEDDATIVTGSVFGLKPYLHMFISIGSHCNPAHPEDENCQVISIGNVTAGADGVTKVNATSWRISLIGPKSIIGRAVIVHADRNDLGKGGHEPSKSAGNAGGRIAWGLIS